MKMTQISSFEEQVRKSISAKVIPSPAEFKTIPVEVLTKDSLIEKFAEVEYTAIEIAFANSTKGVPFTQEDFTKYCKSIVKNRVEWVNSNRQEMMFRPEERIAVPALLYVVTANIGKAYDVQRGLTIVPETKYKHELKKEECLKISLFLQSIPNYEGAIGYLKDKNGSWDFMSMQVINSVIQNDTATPHPVYAFIAAIVGPVQLKNALKPYVKYGDLNLLSELLWEFSSL